MHEFADNRTQARIKRRERGGGGERKIEGGRVASYNAGTSRFQDIDIKMSSQTKIHGSHMCTMEGRWLLRALTVFKMPMVVLIVVLDDSSGLGSAQQVIEVVTASTVDWKERRDGSLPFFWRLREQQVGDSFHRKQRGAKGERAWKMQRLGYVRRSEEAARDAQRSASCDQRSDQRVSLSVFAVAVHILHSETSLSPSRPLQPDLIDQEVSQAYGDCL